MLIALPYAIARLDDLFDISQQVVIALQHRQGLLQICKPEVSRLEFVDDIPACRFDLNASRIGFPVSHGSTKAALPREENLLRDAETYIGKLTIAVTGKRARASHAELLKGDLRVGKGRRLARHMCCRRVAAFRRRYRGIILLGLLNQFLKTHRDN